MIDYKYMKGTAYNMILHVIYIYSYAISTLNSLIIEITYFLCNDRNNM